MNRPSPVEGWGFDTYDGICKLFGWPEALVSGRD